MDHKADSLDGGVGGGVAGAKQDALRIFSWISIFLLSWDIGMSAEVNILEEQEDSALRFSTTLIFGQLISSLRGG